MFLMSEAFRSLDPPRLQRWDWHAASILFVSHGWDPALNSAQGITGRRLVQALLHAGAHVHVLAGSRAAVEFSGDRYSLTVVPSPRVSGHRIGRAWQMVRCGIPETAGPWVAGAVEAGVRALASMPGSPIIYGRAFPGSSNIAAWYLSRISGLPFVAHFSDYWPPRNPLSHGRGWLAPYKWPLFQMWRRRIVRDAGALTFSNPRQAVEVLGCDASTCTAKTFVVAHLGSRIAARVTPPQYETFHIVHTGNLYRGQSWATVMQAVRLFLESTPGARGRVRLTQAGWSHGDLEVWSYRCGLQDVVRIAGRVSQEDVVELLDTASLLLALDYERPDSTTVLSKLPDYINAGRPILAITAPGTSLAQLFTADGAGLTAHYASPYEAAQRIRAVFEAWQHRRLDSLAPARVAAESYQRRRVLAELAAAMLVARQPSGVASPLHEPQGV